MAPRTVVVRKPRDIGDAIRAVREARGISQEELAAQANAYDRFYLNGLEAGRSTMYITRLLRTLKSLGIRSASRSTPASRPMARAALMTDRRQAGRVRADPVGDADVLLRRRARAGC
jgi:transcriptional regulator with XRE-family HTH domain